MKIRIEADNTKYMIHAENEIEAYTKIIMALANIIENKEKVKLISITREEI